MRLAHSDVRAAFVGLEAIREGGSSLNKECGAATEKETAIAVEEDEVVKSSAGDPEDGEGERRVFSRQSWV